MKRRLSPHERESAREWKIAVMERSGGRCVVSGERGEHAHHVLPQQLLRRRAKTLGVDPAWLLWDARCGILLSEETHRRHHNGRAPIPHEYLPAGAFEFAYTYGLGWYLAKHYPAEEQAA